MEFLYARTRGDMKSRGEDILSAILPLAKLLTLTVIGLMFAHPKTQIIPRATFKLLSKLVFFCVHALHNICSPWGVHHRQEFYPLVVHPGKPGCQYSHRLCVGVLGDKNLPAASRIR